MASSTTRLTAGQAVIRFLINQYIVFDDRTEQFFGGIWGIFGHGNIGGLAQAIQQYEPELPYYLARNEQAMVHAAVGYAKMKNRRGAMACLSSIGPGATNMVTGAATATVNRLPVLIMAGDTFAERVQAPVLQQVESASSQEMTANDTFKPVVRYWDRISRPEQVITSLPEVMRTLTSPSDTGAVFLAMPQDVGSFAYDYPIEFFEQRHWHIARNRADSRLISQAAEMVRQAQRPLIFAGGGVRYSEAQPAVQKFAESHGIPVAETHAGRGTLSFDHPLSLGGAGVAGTRGANLVAEQADLVIGVGTRYTDFVTASKTAFQNPNVKFININVFEMDAFKHAGVGLIGDARVTVEELDHALGEFGTSKAYRDEISEHNRWWDGEVTRIYRSSEGSLPSQGSLIGAVEASSTPRDVVVTSSGSLPGDLLKLWRSREALSYQVEYGYSVMGYEIAGGLGAKMADSSREVYVMVGDGAFLMMNSEIATAVQEDVKLIIVIVDNHGFSSVGRVSEQVGCEGYGCHYRKRGNDNRYTGAVHRHDLASIARGLGAHTIEATSLDDFVAALAEARASENTTCIVVETDWDERVPGYASCWWDMATAEVSEMEAVSAARKEYEKEKHAQRWLMALPR